MRKLYIVGVLLFCAVSGFSQLYKVENEEKAVNSTLIVEGKVVEQTSFWNPQHTMIFTANKVQVYKMFKGDGTPAFIEVMTQGGTVGDISVQASDLLELRKNDIGVFFCFPNTGNLRSPNTSERLYDVYASSQGHFVYDVYTGKAGSPFQSFNSITNELYPMITGLTHQPIKIIDPSFDLNSFRTANTAGRTAVSISSITPTTVHAGATKDPVNNILTITGSDFGTPSGSAAVLFADDNNGGASNFAVAYSDPEMISWTDNLIQVRVPTRAGTGQVFVRNSAGTTSGAAFDILTVDYSILTFSGKQSNLINANGSGGYSMKYSTNMSAAENTTFNRALTTWIEVSGLNVIDGGTIGVQTVTGDNQCVVMMDNAAANSGTPLASGVLAVCYSFNSTCGGSADNRKPEFDIVIRSSYSTGSVNFAYGPCAPQTSQIDLETVILHELGHALNHGHIIDGLIGAAPNANPGKLMNYAVANGVKRVSPDFSAFQGSLYTINGVVTNYGICTSATNMVPLVRTNDAKDEYPAIFPIAPTASGLQVNFDLVHATSNKYKDPPYNNLLCSAVGANVTNNLYFPIRTSSTGSTLNMSISNFLTVPSNVPSDCFINAPFVRMTLYQFGATMPTGPNDFGNPVACTNFYMDGALAPITGLLPNTNYLLYVDGKSNAKSTFTVTFSGNVLPVRLEKFVGEVKADFNLLKWSIATFNDVDKLVLQKSANAVDFSAIYEQRAFETAREYSFNDYKPFAGKNYYRLAIYNKDGSVQYSNVVVLNREEKVRISVYPNPVKNNIHVSITASENISGLKLLVYNSIGQVVVSQTANLAVGINSIDIQSFKLASGMYKIVAIDKNGTTYASLNVQKL